MADHSCTTMLNEHKFNFVWTIENFPLHLQIWDGIGEEYALESSSYSWSNYYQDSKYHIQLIVTSRSQLDDSGHIYLALHSSTSKPMVKVKFSIICMHDESLNIHRTSNTRKVSDSGEIIHGFSDSISQPEVLQRLDCDKNLTITCELTAFTSRIWKIDVAPSQLQTDYANFYKQQINTDFTFIVIDKKFPVHKLILKARSPVFAAMLTCEMTEQVKNKAFITDIEAPVFEKLLEFIYTDTVTDMGKFALDLLVAADKYQLESLKILCEKTVRQDVKVSNAAAIFIIAYQYSAKNLLEFVRNFIIINRKEVVETLEFKEVEKSRDLMLILYKP